MQFFLHSLLLTEYIFGIFCYPETNNRAIKVYLDAWIAPLCKILLYSRSFKKAADSHLKSADNCFLLSDSSCKSVCLTAETSVFKFFLKLPSVLRDKPKQSGYIHRVFFDAICFYGIMDDFSGVTLVAVDGMKQLFYPSHLFSLALPSVP